MADTLGGSEAPATHAPATHEQEAAYEELGDSEAPATQAPATHEQEATYEERRAMFRAAMQPRAKRWADSHGGLVALLDSLEADWPHTFAMPAGLLGAGTPRPWVPRDATEKEILRAFKKASLHLHPDRLLAARRDLSVVIEAEEVLKVLNEAQGRRGAWLKGPPAAASAAAASRSTGAHTASKPAAAAAPGPSQAASAKAPPPRPTTAHSVRDELFGSASAAASSGAASNQRARAASVVDDLFSQPRAAPASSTAGPSCGSGPGSGAPVGGPGNAGGLGGGAQSATDLRDAIFGDVPRGASGAREAPHRATAGVSVRDSVFGQEAGFPPPAPSVKNPFESHSCAPPAPKHSHSFPSAKATGQTSRSAVDDLFAAPRAGAQGQSASNPFSATSPHTTAAAGAGPSGANRDVPLTAGQNPFCATNGASSGAAATNPFGSPAGAGGAGAAPPDLFGGGSAPSSRRPSNPF